MSATGFEDREQRVNMLMTIEVVTQELNNWEHGNLELIKCVVVHIGYVLHCNCVHEVNTKLVSCARRVMSVNNNLQLGDPRLRQSVAKLP